MSIKTNKAYQAFDPKIHTSNLPSGIDAVIKFKGWNIPFKNGKIATDRHPVTLEKLDME